MELLVDSDGIFVHLVLLEERIAFTGALARLGGSSQHR